MKKKKVETMFYKDLDSLQPVVDVINEASITLGDPTRTLKDSPLNEVFNAIANGVGAGAGAGMSFLALYGLGTTGLSAVGITTALATAGSLIGGGMVAGVLVLSTLPAVGIALTGGIIAKGVKRKHLKEVKRDLYVEVEDRIAKLNIEINDNKESIEDRVSLLDSLVMTLTKISSELQHDLILV